MSVHYIKYIGKVEYLGHEDSLTMGTYDIEEMEKSNENKVDIIWEQSQQIDKLKEELKESKQEKIKFAIAELRNVKEFVDGITDVEELAHYILNRVDELRKQLTHQHEDKGE